MSTSPVCSRCGAVNIPVAMFCIRCGNQLTAPIQPQIQVPAQPQASPTQAQTPSALPQVALPVQPQVTSPPYAGPPTFFQPMPQYNYAAAMAAQTRAREIDRTKTGLLLILIGVLLIPLPYIVYVGEILILIGAILVIVGRKVFGTIHARNTIWSIIVFVIGIGVVIGGSIPYIVAVASATIAGIAGTLNTTTASQSLSSSFQLLLIFSVVGGAIFGIAEVLFTYALQKQTGKILLWTGYAAALAVSIIEFILIGPQVESAASQSFTGTTYNPVPLANLQTQQQILGLLLFIPAIIYVSAIYLAWARIKTGELPGTAPQPQH